MAARRARVCRPHGHAWQYAYDGQRENLACPTCGGLSMRAFIRYLLRAGRRGGKTRICALAMIEELTIPHVWWWATAPTYRMLEDYVLPAFFNQIPQAWIDHPATAWSESELTLRLPNRSIAQFRSLENPDSGRGPGLNGIWMDEIALLTLLHWETIAPTLTDKRGILLAGTTPRGPDWVHERFWQYAEQGMRGYWATHYSSLHNPSLDPDAIEEARRTMTPLMFRQEYMADIVTFTGAIYGEILGPCLIDGTDEELKAYFPEWPAIDPNRPAISGLDPGTDHPFGGVHLVASPRGLVAVGEYLQRQKPFAIHAEGIKAMRRGSDARIAIDSAAPQAAIELAQYDLFTTTVEKDVVAGINRVSAWMLASAQKRFPGPVRNTVETSLPSGLVLPRSLVPQLVRQLEGYRWADPQKADGSLRREQVYKKDDDLCFVAGTAVTTPSGGRPIEDIHAGDLVWTRAGWRPVVVAGSTGTRPVWRVIFSTGGALTGTGAHPIWDGAHWRRLDALRSGDILPRWPDGSAFPGLGCASTGTRTALHGPIASIGRRMWGTAARGWMSCIAKCGRGRTGRFQTGTSSITATGIRSTIVSVISCVSVAVLTRRCISAAGPSVQASGLTWLGFGPRPWRGIDRPVDARGIAAKDARRGWGARVARTPATDVSVGSSRGRGAGSASARRAADRPGAGRFSVTTKYVAVWRAVRRFGVASGRRHGVARDSVAHVSASVPAGIARVYNLQVADCPEYVANGILVHNCDPLRYALMAYPHLPNTDPATSLQRRDLAGMPDDMRMQIERMRRIDATIAAQQLARRAENGEDVDVPIGPWSDDGDGPGADGASPLAGFDEVWQY